MELVDGTAIFSAGGGGDPEVGYKIVDKLVCDGFTVKLANPSEVPNDAEVVNFACVGATTAVEYESDAAVTAFKALEEYACFSAYAAIPVELGGFNTMVAVDVAARCGIAVVDADGAGRSVPEVHLKVYTIDNIPLTPMVVTDIKAKNIVVVKETVDSKAAERIARTLAAEWDNSAYTARRILTGSQVKTSPIQLSLSRAMRVGKLLKKTVKPMKAILKETRGFKLFEGVAARVERETKAGFTFVDVKLHGSREYAESEFEFKAKNEVLVAYKNGKLAAIAPDIITPVYPETGKCITAEKIEKGDELAVLGLPAPQKWRTSRGLELWKNALKRSNIFEEYVPIKKLAANTA